MENQTVDKWLILENFLNSLKLSAMDENTSLSENTILARRQDITQLLNAFENPFILTSKELRDWLLSFRGNAWNRATTYIRKINSIKLFYKFSKEENLIEKDPAEFLKYPRKPRDFKRKAFTSEQLIRIVKVAEAPCMSIRDRAVFFTLITSGLRTSELCSTKKENLNLKDKMIYIPKEDNKGRKVSKRVPFSDKAKAYLEQYISEDVLISSPYLFHREDGTRLSRQKVYHIVEDVIARAFPNESEWSDALGGHILRHCVSADTKVLSKEGWKKYSELKIGEQIYTFNLKTRNLELSSLRSLFVFPRQGKMLRIKNRYLDCLITPEHKIPIRFSTKLQGNKKRIGFWCDWTLMEIQKLQFKDLRAIDYLLSAKKKNSKEKLGILKSALLGWIMTDGHLSKRKDITISQSFSANPKNCCIIRKILKKSGLKYSEHKTMPRFSGYHTKKKPEMMVFRILKRDTGWIYDWLNSDSSPKYVILDLSLNELTAVFNSMMLANGSRSEIFLSAISKRKSTEFCDQDKRKIDFFRVLSLFLGFRTVLSRDEKWRTYISKKNFCRFEKKQIEKISYKGIVWCPSTKNKTFIAKRRESIFITGNSFATMFLESGGDRSALQHILGYTSQKEIEIYAAACTLSREFINREAQKVERIFKKRHNL